MKKHFYANIVFLLLACSLMLILFSSCGSRGTDIPKEAEYLVFYSAMLSPKSGYYYINGAGDHLGKPTTIKMQDLSRFDVSDMEIVLSGERKNNTLILSKGTPVPNSDFCFLNDSSYSGLTAIKIREDALIGIMNGGFSEGIYQTLLVVQGKGSGVLPFQKTLNIYAHSITDYESTLYVAGTYMESEADWCAKIIKYDFVVDGSLSRNYSQYAGFWHSLQYEDSLICIAESLSQNKDTIVFIDKTSFEVIKEIRIPDYLNSLFEHEDKLYVIGDSGIYGIDNINDAANLIVEFKQHVTGDCYVDFSYWLDGNVYAFCRNNTREELTDKTYNYGELLKVDMSSYAVSQTPIIGSGDMRMDNIFAIPSNYMSN